VRYIRLDPGNPERVRLIFAIERGTPIKVDTVAVLKTQGLTGIAYVELSGGNRDSPALLPSAPGEFPVIRTKPSLSARLENVLTNVLAKLDRTSSHIDALLSDDNQRAFSSALADIAVVAHTIAARQKTIAAGITSAARTFDNSERASARVGPVIEQIGQGAAAVEKLGNEAALASRAAGQTVARVGADVERLTAQAGPELQRLLDELNVLAVSLRRLTEQTERNPSSLLFGRGKTADGPGENSTGKRP
jgi:phospholipid/cholesterol/gamma-HCH transport system substrate-binding protein